MTTIKKLFLTMAMAGIIASIGFTANAQLFPYTGTSTSASSSVVTPPSTTTTSMTNSGTNTSTINTNNSTTNSSTVNNSSNTVSTSTNTTNTTTFNNTFTGSVLGASTTGNSTGSTLGSIGPIFVTSPQTTVNNTGNGTATNSTATNNSGWVQLNGLIVSAVSGTTSPATITASNPNAICVWFFARTSPTGTTGACPVISASQIQVSAGGTVLLRDRSRGVLANITSGDEINAFGFYGTDGTFQAAIVRDLSKPQVGLVPNTGGLGSGSGTTITTLFPALTNLDLSGLATMSATITQVNSDGSFVVQLSNGRTFTVPNFVHVGQTVNFQQLVNWVNNKLNGVVSTTTQ